MMPRAASPVPLLPDAALLGAAKSDATTAKKSR